MDLFLTNKSKKKPQNFGTCFLCGLQLTENSRNTRYSSGERLADGTYICHHCIRQMRLIIRPKTTKAGILVQMRAAGLLLPDQFTATRYVRGIGKICADGTIDDFVNCIELDEPKELILIPHETDDAFYQKVHRFKEVLDFELQMNGETITNGNGFVEAVIGGLTFGAAGAIVGSGMNDKVSKELINRMSIKIVFNDMDDPDETIFIISGQRACLKGTRYYNEAFQKAQEIMSLLKIILEGNKDAKDNVIVSSKVSVADEIRKFKELLDMGAITEAEYEAKKQELLEM